MSFGGGGGGDNSWMMIQQLNRQRDEAQAEANRIKAENDAKKAEEEKKRVERVKGGGLSGFTTNNYVGYSDRLLGGGQSLTATV